MVLLVLQVLQVFWSSWSSRSCGRPGHAGRPPGLLSKLSGPSSRSSRFSGLLVLHVLWSSSVFWQNVQGDKKHQHHVQSCEAENLRAEILLRRVFLLGSVTPVTPVTLQAKLQKQKDQRAFVEAKQSKAGTAHMQCSTHFTQFFSLSGLFCEDMCHPSAESLPHPLNIPNRGVGHIFFFEPRILYTAPEFVMPSPNRTFLLFVPNLAF